MRRTLLGSAIIGALLFGSIGAALAHTSRPAAAARGMYSAECLRFHTPKPEVKVTAADYARCAGPFVEAVQSR
jgi:hypothetical protein